MTQQFEYELSSDQINRLFEQVNRDHIGPADITEGGVLHVDEVAVIAINDQVEDEDLQEIFKEDAERIITKRN